jgi:methylated-DNA-[protein]-cysteine S-methyltransferase
VAHEAAPTPDVRHAINGIVALLAGEKRDLTDIAIDDGGLPDFNRRVYAIVRKIPPGATITYGEIAERLGDKTLSREVGQAMGENPTPIIMPCHRVLAAGGKTGGFSASGGVVTKLRPAHDRRCAARRADFIRKPSFGCAKAWRIINASTRPPP